MSYIQGADRGQGFLLPESIEDYVGPEHPVRAIEAFVDALDLGRIGFARAVPAATGRPPYAPGDLLKLYLWGYFNRVSSSRRLEAECARNLEVLWLLRRLTPDFKTIADFRRENARALKEVFRQFVLVCRELGLFGRELVAIDGTKLKASNHPTARADAAKLQVWLAAIDARIAEYLAAAQAGDESEAEPTPPPLAPAEMAAKLAALRRRKDKLTGVLARALESGGEVPLHDPDAQRMIKVGLGYNAQSAVDDKHHLIAVAEVAAEPTDYQQLPVIAAQASAVLRAPNLRATADGGYHDQEALAQAEAAGVECHVPRPQKGHAVRLGVHGKSLFVYDAARDAYRCPAGESLARNGAGYRKAGLFYQAYANGAACRACPQKAACTKGDYRRVERWEKEEVMEAIAARVAAHPEILGRRKALVEHPFGTIKFWWNQGALLTRGREHVQAELSLSALTYNLKRALAVLGTSGLIAGLSTLKRGARAAGGSACGPQPGCFGAWSACGWLAAAKRHLRTSTRTRHGAFAARHRLTLAA